MLNRLKDVFKSFELCNVKYVVIGGIAAILHGVPRATFDLDILIDATEKNAKKLLQALEKAGLGTATLTTPAEVVDNEITIFKDHIRIDVQTSTPGITFDCVWQNRKKLNYRGQEFFILSREDLIKSKKASGRKVDLEDVMLLEIASDDPSV
jgi:Nucleotidyltransferase of unknown function (DUF6036)